MKLKVLFLLLIYTLFFQGTIDKTPKAPLFTLLDPKDTNIRFNNKIVEDRDRNILIYDNFYAGAGVGIGDFNNDGLADIYFTGNLVGDKLYLNKGNFKFEDITGPAGIIDNGSWSSGVTVADVNNDGFVDIFVCKELYDDNPELWVNQLYINNGDLTFSESAEKYGLNDTVRTRQASFFDYDVDGDLDVFLLNHAPNPGDYSRYDSLVGTGKLLLDKYSPRLYENVNGKYKDVSKKAGVLRAGYGNSLVTSDLNADGYPDIYLANDFEAPDFLYINNGDGTFTDKANDALKHTPLYSMGVDAADINNDGLPDLMAVDMTAEDNYRLKANMGGMNPDNFWSIVNNGWNHQYMFNTLQLNLGNNAFSEISQLANVSSTDWSWSPLILDLDNDGHKDIFVSNGILRDIRNKDAQKKFKLHVNDKIIAHYNKTGTLEDVKIWDLIDVDEALNIYPSQKLANYTYRNNGDFTFTKKSKEWGFAELSFSHGAGYADLDNDGDLDLVINNVNDPAFIYRNNTNEIADNHFLRVKLRKNGKFTSFFGATATIKYGDGEMQFLESANVRGMYSTSEAVFHFGLGASQSISNLKITWPDKRVYELRNVQADQVLIVDYEASVPAVAYQRDAATLFTDVTEKADAIYHHVENEFDDYQRQVLLPHKMSNFGPGLAVGDVNGDGLEDFFIGAALGKSGSLFIQNAKGAFYRQKSGFESQYEDIGAVFFDADRDGDNDLYVVSGGNEYEAGSDMYQDRLYINDGNGNFLRDLSALPRITSSGSKVIANDYDNDGDLDLFVGALHVPGAYPKPASSHLLRNDFDPENGLKFTDVTQSNALVLKDIGMVTDGVWSDFDQDGDDDLVLTGIWMPVTFIKNEAGIFSDVTKDYRFDNPVGWWFSIEKNDIDNDGDDDYIVGNLGLNSKYKSSKEEPFTVHYYDFDKNGSQDIVLGYYNYGIHYPVRGRSCSAQQVNALNEIFPDYSSFALATLSDVYGEKNLSRSLHYKAQSFASAIVERKEKNSFEMKALPVESQFSAINDMVIIDINKDGNKDLVVAGNLYPMEVETSRADAGVGLYLKGLGNGKFQSVPTTESGLFLPYDVKEMQLIQTTKGVYLLVASNNGPLKVIEINTDTSLSFKN